MKTMPPLNTILQGDCLSIMRGWPDGCVDLIVTDPPYGINYKSNVKTKYDKTSARRADSSFGVDEAPSLEVWEQAYRLLSDGGAIYTFCSWDALGFVASQLIMAGFSCPIRMVWDKVCWGAGDLRYYGQQTEDILFSAKGNHRLRLEKREGNLWQVWKAEMWNQPGGHTGHPNEKPTSIIKKAILSSSDKGQRVLDMYAGSGTTSVACLQTGRNFMGIELNQKYCAIAQARVDAERAQGKLFL